MKILKYLEFIKIQFYICFKKLIEYKSNMYLLFIEHMIFGFCFILMYSVLYDNFKNIMPWTLNDFILFFIIHDYIIILAGIFYWGKDIFNEITRGIFNIYLTKPINIFINYIFNDLTYQALIFFIGDTFFNLFVIWFFKIKVNLLNLFYMLPAFFLLVILFLVIINFSFSFDFKFKGIGKHIYRIYSDSNNVIRYYPPYFFHKIKYNIGFIMFSSYFTGIILMPLIKGESYLNLLNELLLAIFIILILSIVIVINWKNGLKKYEAYN